MVNGRGATLTFGNQHATLAARLRAEREGRQVEIMSGLGRAEANCRTIRRLVSRIAASDRRVAADLVEVFRLASETADEAARDRELLLLGSPPEAA